MDITPEKFPHPFFYDHKPGFLLGWGLYRLFKRFKFDEGMKETLRQMNREGNVVYAIKYPGHLDYLLCHYRFRTSRLPYPKLAFNINMLLFLPLSKALKIFKFYATHLLRHRRLPDSFDTGFFKGAIQQGITSLICLVDPKGFARHFIHSEKDSVHLLLETQMGMVRPIYIVPQLVLYKKTPEKDHSSILEIFFGLGDNPGPLRKVILFLRHNRHALIDFGRPLNLKDFLENQLPSRPLEELSQEVRQMLIERIDAQKRVGLGPVMKSRQQVKERVLRDQEVIQAIEKMGSGNAERLKQIKKRAGEEFDRIAADYSAAYVQFGILILNWLWRRIFQDISIDKQGLATVREWARKGTLIYSPSHKSHIDYLVLNQVLYDHHMAMPRIAAGQNLAFWPMGHFLKKCGAFFIRRTFTGAKLYTKIFTSYIRALLEEGQPLEFFIEGGRSRSGKLILPQVGFLSILLNVYKEGYCNNLVFIPASIIYDRILEEKSYLKEIRGGAKEQESLKEFLKARDILKRKYGRIYIRFGQPVSLKEYLEQELATGEEAAQRLAFDLIRSINRVTLVTPLALMATAILTKHRRGFDLKQLRSTTESLSRFLTKYEIPKAPSLVDLDQALKETISLLVGWKVVGLLEEKVDGEIFYFVAEEKKRELEYYKNSIIHYFIPHAYVAVSLLIGREDLKTEKTLLADYQFLKDLFKNEFVYEEGGTIEEEVGAATSYFLEASYLRRSNGGYLLTGQGLKDLPLWAGLAKTFIESYWIATRSFIQRRSENGGKSELLKNMNHLGHRLHELGLIDNLEAISHLNFKNALLFLNRDVLQAKGKAGKDRSKAQEKLSQLSQRLYELSHYRIED
ncbi:MAG: 1-acyl-sn-glycerol-3-phosphate acyltransferase [Pseudomonadota bacterium]